jgi:hypothetical protein
MTFPLSRKLFAVADGNDGGRSSVLDEDNPPANRQFEAGIRRPPLAASHRSSGRPARAP